MRTPIRLLVAATLLAACGDDTAGAGGSGAAGGDGGAGGDVGGAAGGGAGEQGGGGHGTAAGSGGDAAGGGDGACPSFPIEDGSPAACADAGPLAMPIAGEVGCTSDPAVAWPARLYAVTVEAGDCLHMRADDVGATAGADLFGALVDPGGKSTLLDDEVPCSIGGAVDVACPQGGITIEESGTAVVVVGAWESVGCPADGSTPYELTVSIGGVDVDLADAALCAGDLYEIIP